MRRKVLPSEVSQAELDSMVGTIFHDGRTELITAPRRVDGEWRCLANVSGCLYLVTVNLTRPFDPGTGGER